MNWMMFNINEKQMFEVDCKLGLGFEVKSEYQTTTGFGDDSTKYAFINLICYEGTNTNINKFGVIRGIVLPCTTEEDEKNIEMVHDFLNSVAITMSHLVWEQMEKQKAYFDLFAIMNSEESRLTPTDKAIYGLGYDLFRAAQEYTRLYGITVINTCKVVKFIDILCHSKKEQLMQTEEPKEKEE